MRSTRRSSKYADYLIDFHTAMTADVRWALFANIPGEVGKKGEGIARAFGYRSTLPAPPDILRRLRHDDRREGRHPGLHRRGGGKGPPSPTRP